MDDPCRIRFCVLNPRSNQERDMLVDEGCEMRDCLGQCSLCFETRFLEANQTVIDEPDDYAELLAKARQICAEHARGQTTAR